MTTSVRDALVGHVLDGRYRVESRIARGGMSVVYRATDLRLDRAVAVKVMHPSFAEDPGFVERFQREAKAAARLSHPHVVAVHDQGADDGVVYLVMEYVPGRTLRDVLREHGPLAAEQALALLDPVLQALAAAHAAGYVHRDVKPENVLVSDTGRVTVADFGLARALAAPASTATQGLLIGTVAYLSPEQVDRGGADARSDVYGAGILLFELLTGTVPFTGETPLQVAYRHVNDDVPYPSRVRPSLPAETDVLVARATARDPEGRYPDAAAFLADLRRARSVLPEPRPFADTRGTLVVPRDQLLEWSSAPGAHPSLPPAPVPEPRARGLFARLRGRDGAGRDGAARDGAHLDPAARDGAGRGASAPGVPGPGAAAAAGPPAPDPPAPGAGRRPSGGSAPRPPGRGTPPPGARRPAAGAAPAGRPAARRRRRAPVVLLALLLVAALGGAGTWWLTAGPGRTVAVPPLVGKTEQSAAQVLQSEGLELVVRQRVFSETVAAGKVMRTEPVAGASLHGGDPVAVVVSRGKERYAVPKVAGTTLEQAEAALAKARLGYAGRDRAWDETVPEGKVVGTDPAAGASLKRGTAVTVVVSRGPEPRTVPRLVGSSLDSAKSKLDALRLVLVERGEEYSTSISVGLVVRTSPGSGNEVPRGSEVGVVVSKGPPPVTVPNLYLLTRDDAAAKLRALGLGVNEEETVITPFNRVSGQSPSAGEVVPYGTTVTITIT